MEFGYLKKMKNLVVLRMEKLPRLDDPPPEYREAKLNSLLTYMKARLKK